jgi:hypothetical protein
MRKPIPLTQLKRRSAEPPPVPAAASAPIQLTRRKSGRHKTLPLGPTAAPEPELVAPKARPRR